MSDTGTDGPDPVWNGQKATGPSDSPRSGLIALIVAAGKRPACTIFPPDVVVPQRTTTWITAHGDSFVGLKDCR